MKAAACVPTGGARAPFYLQPDVIIVSFRFGLTNAFSLTDSERIGQAQTGLHRSSKATYILSDQDESHVTKQNSRTLITVGVAVGCPHF